MALIAALLFFASAVQRERQQILGELVSRHIEERVPDVAAAVGLEAFESPAFHNRLQRVRTAAHQPMNRATCGRATSGSTTNVWTSCDGSRARSAPSC